MLPCESGHRSDLFAFYYSSMVRPWISFEIVRLGIHISLRTTLGRDCSEVVMDCVRNRSHITEDTVTGSRVHLQAVINGSSSKACGRKGANPPIIVLLIDVDRGWAVGTCIKVGQKGNRITVRYDTVSESCASVSSLVGDYLRFTDPEKSNVPGES